MLILSEKWHDLTWFRIDPKFNLYHLQEISAGFKMAVLTLKSGISLDLTVSYFSSVKLSSQVVNLCW